MSWTGPFIGPRGGVYWQNQRGEKLYQRERPGSERKTLSGFAAHRNDALLKAAAAKREVDRERQAMKWRFGGRSESAAIKVQKTAETMAFDYLKAPRAVPINEEWVRHTAVSKYGLFLRGKTLKRVTAEAKVQVSLQNMFGKRK